MAEKKYIVKLSLEERSFLEEFLRKGRRSAELVTRARILLKADVSEAGDGWTDEQIMEALDTSKSNVSRTRQRLVETGFEDCMSRSYNPKSARPMTFDGEAEARLIALTCSAPPEGHAKWSLRLLEEKFVELKIVERASDSTIGRTLKKTSSSRT